MKAIEYSEILRNLSESTGHAAYLFTGLFSDMDWFDQDFTSDGMYEFGPHGMDNCMGFQSDGNETRIEFREGSYEWGNKVVTGAALNIAKNWRFA